MEEHSNKKRVREDEAEFDLPEVKKIRDDLLDILDESDPEATAQDLDSVMKSFEEELSASSSSSPVVVDLTSDSGESSQPDLGYLLEASDDELGLPPSVTSLEEDRNGVTELVRVDSAGNDGFWGFEDQIPSYDSFELGIVEYNTEYAAFDDGLFDHSSVCFDSSDYSWRLGTMPAE